MSNTPEDTALRDILFDLFRSGRTTYTPEDYEQVEKAHNLITLHTQKRELSVRIETAIYVDNMLRFENIPLHIVQAESIKGYIKQLKAQLTNPTERSE